MPRAWANTQQQAAPTRRPQKRRWSRAGFTLLELLTAIVVLGVASTVFIRLYTSSQSLAKAGRTHEIAAQLAEEYLALIQTRPDLFVWPNYADKPVGTRLPVTPRENGPVEATIVHVPDTMPIQRRAYNRERALYDDFTWEASARLPAADAQYVELSIEMSWTLDGRLRRFTLTSAVPRSTAEGVGL